MKDKLDMKQLLALLKVFILVDLRAGASLPGKISRSKTNLFWMLFFYGLMGTIVGASLLLADLPLRVGASVLYCMLFVYVSLNILIEYQEILMSPQDGDVLFWRPISSKTIFLAKVMNLLFYVTLLAGSMLLVPTLLAMVHVDEHRVLVGGCLFIGGLLNAYAAAAVTILLYGGLLKWVSAQRLQDLLAYVQLAFSIIVFTGYQLLRPLLESVADGDHSSLFVLSYVPPGWYASYVAMAEGGWTGSSVGLAAIGWLFLGLSGLFALRRLAPHYREKIAESSAATAPSRLSKSREVSVFRRWFAGMFARGPLRLAGFDFFLANLRGDRRIKISLLPVVVLPALFAVFGLVSEGAQDPYVVVEGAGLMDRIEEVIESDLSPSSAELRRSVGGGVFAFTPAYMLAIFCLSLSRTANVSTHWRACWVFYASPRGHFERFYEGCLVGMVYGLLLPSAVFLAAVFSFAWLNPFHVALHLLVPATVGVALLPFGLLLGELAPPFSREPARGGRSLDLLMAAIGAPFAGGVGVAHFFMRDDPLKLVGLAAVVGGIGCGLWLLARRRFRKGLGESPV